MKHCMNGLRVDVWVIPIGFSLFFHHLVQKTTVGSQGFSERPVPYITADPLTGIGHY